MCTRLYQITASTRKIRARILPALWVGGKFICLRHFSTAIQIAIFYSCSALFRWIFSGCQLLD